MAAKIEGFTVLESRIEDYLDTRWTSSEFCHHSTVFLLSYYAVRSFITIIDSQITVEKKECFFDIHVNNGENALGTLMVRL